MIKRWFTLIKNNRRLQITIAFILILVLFQAYNMFSTYKDQQQVKQATIEYLQSKNYNVDKQVASIDVYLSELKNKNYMAAVIFNDEKEAVYFYAYTENTDEIEQADYEHTNKNLDVSDIEFKHVE